MNFNILAIGIKDDFLDSFTHAMRKKQYRVVPTFSEGVAHHLLMQQRFSLIILNMSLFIDHLPLFCGKTGSATRFHLLRWEAQRYNTTGL
ncbi:MAG: hypothetical protein K2O45_03400 [Oscillospiraceae bacterium]|nr:hypothetical protein [Oscillospiraceae bacterium]